MIVNIVLIYVCFLVVFFKNLNINYGKVIVYFLVGVMRLEFKIDSVISIFLLIECFYEYFR